MNSSRNNADPAFSAYQNAPLTGRFSLTGAGRPVLYVNMKTQVLNTPDYIRSLRSDFDRASAAHPGHPVLALAADLIAAAQRFDVALTQKLGVNFRFRSAVRDAAAPVEIRHESVIGKDWADDPAHPLQKGEAWNAGRRATLTGAQYALDAKGWPLSPYLNAGLTGQGVLGQFGPNHAVDNGILQARADGLYALGIIRKYDDNAPAFAGGFAKYKKDAQGGYILDADAIVTSKAEEFFEEMVSGSIDLLPEYEARLAPMLDKTMADLAAARGKPVGAVEWAEITAQVETELKLEQVEHLDPGFMRRLKDVLSKGRECFAGPLLNDNRTTNNAWIETQLSWIELDTATWDYIKGPAPRFAYDLCAGDDAAGVVWHRIDGDLMEKAFASHGPMFAFMAASYLVARVESGVKVPDGVLSQTRQTLAALDRLAPKI